MLNVKNQLAKITERLIHVRCGNKLSILFCFMQVVSENQLTLFRPTEFSIKFDTVMSGWSIVYIGGSQVII